MILTAAVVAVVMSALVVVPAMADTGNGGTRSAGSLLSISLDGVLFTPQTAETVFHPELRIIPGGSHSSTVWVRNDAATPGRLRVDVIPGTASDRALADALMLEIGQATRPAGNYWSTSLSGASSCSAIANNIVLKPGEVVALDIVASLGSLSGTEGQNASVAVGFRARLIEAAAPQQQDLQSCSMSVPNRGPNSSPTPQPTPSTNPSPSPEPGPSSSPSPDPGGAGTTLPEPSAPTPGGSATDSEDGGASLPISGASIRLALIMAAILIGAGGMFLVIVRRKKNDDD